MRRLAAGLIRLARPLAAVARCIPAVLTLPLYVLYPPLSGLRTRNPEMTACMKRCNKERLARGLPPVRQTQWVSLDALPPYLVVCAVLSEDGLLPQHKGVHWTNAKNALFLNLQQRKIVAGGSGLAQQLARNLYLSPEKKLIRKLREAILAWRLTRLLEPRRLVELYLNVVEWGDGEFGVQAGALRCFGVCARHLTPLQAALLIALLPAPRAYTPTSPYVRNRAKDLLAGLAHERASLLRRHLALPDLETRVPEPAKPVTLLSVARQTVVDMLRTRPLWRRRRKTMHDYTVVVLLHGTHPGLGALLSSLVRQRVDCAACLRVLVIDRGLCPETSRTAATWAKRHPGIVTVHPCAAGSLALARAQALRRTDTEWVTFVHADDFLDCAYFAHIDAFVRSRTRQGRPLPGALCCKTMLHPQWMLYRDEMEPCFLFKGMEQVVTNPATKREPHLSVHNVIFRARVLRPWLAATPHSGWHEDLSLFARFMHEGEPGSVAFLKRPKYYWTRPCSPTRASWPLTPRALSGLGPDELLLHLEAGLEHDCLNTDHGNLTLCAQAMLFLQKLLNRDTTRAERPLDEKRSLAALAALFSRLDPDRIRDFPARFGGKPFPFTDAVLFHWFGIALPSGQFRVHELLSSSQRLCLSRFCAGHPGSQTVLIDGAPAFPVEEHMQHTLLGRPFILEQLLWLDPPRQARVLDIRPANPASEGAPAVLLVGQERLESPADLAGLREIFEGSRSQVSRMRSAELNLSAEHLVQSLSALHKAHHPLTMQEPPPRSQRSIGRIIIHCSGTKPLEDADLAAIPGDPGKNPDADAYHYRIRRDGGVESRRPLDCPGAHTPGHNADAVDICLTGGMHEDGLTPVNNFTLSQWLALEALVRALKRSFPDAHVCGHRDLAAGDCPCFEVKTWWAGVCGEPLAALRAGIPPLSGRRPD